MNSVQWTGDKTFSVGDQQFLAVHFLDDHQKNLEQKSGFLVFKSKRMIDRYASLVGQLKPQSILELGTYLGGSSVFFHELAQPRKLLTLDINTDRIEQLDAYANSIPTRSLRAIGGVDQTDRAAIGDILREELGDGSLDLVVDDASHLLEQSTESFNFLFPRLKPGGVYVLEDWSWAHARALQGKTWMGQENEFLDKEPLSKLVMEIILACPFSRQLIRKVEINENSALIWRGSASVDADCFDIGEHLSSRTGEVLKARSGG